jgi:8-oxo-dGTP pyrophosphatase MutT (NUDIX family)/uncharacterized HAD superfamily protein
MKIGLDLDEVTAEFLEHMIRYYNAANGKNLSKEDFHSYNFWEVWGGTREESIEMADKFHNSKGFDKIHPAENAIESIRSIASKNKFMIITSRPKNWKTKTERWVRRHLGDINCKIIYTNDFHKGKGKTKSEICIEEGIGVMVEDHEKYSVECAEKGIKVILFDKPWNKNARHRNITRVSDWLDAVEKISSIGKSLEKPIMNFRRAVFAVAYARESGKIAYLLLKRKKHWKGWEFPKGGIDEGESERSAVKREVFEETGLRPINGIVRRFNFRGKYLYRRKFLDRGKMMGQSFVLYAAEVRHGKVKIDKKEHSDYRWLGFREAMKTLTHENQKKALSIVDKYLKR